MGYICEILDVPENNPCMQCITCMRLKLMELGFISGQKIEIESKKFGLYRVRVISNEGIPENIIALREDEFERLCIK